MNRPLAVAAIACAAAIVLAVAVAVASAAVSPQTDVHRYGKPFCGTGWDWTETSPRMIVHAAGSCASVPGEHAAAFAVTTAEPGTFPNIGDGIELGADSCPSAADMRGGLCDRYPVRADDEGEPYGTVKSWLAPGYDGNLAYDLWYSPSAARDTYAGRCAASLADAYTEVMVWVAHPGDYPGQPGDYTLQLGGRRWRPMTWETTTGCPAGEGWRLVIFEAPDVADGAVIVHRLKLNVFAGYAIAQGWMSGRSWLDAIDLGFEIHSGGTGNRVEGYALTGGAR